VDFGFSSLGVFIKIQARTVWVKTTYAHALVKDRRVNLELHGILIL